MLSTYVPMLFMLLAVAGLAVWSLLRGRAGAPPPGEGAIPGRPLERFRAAAPPLLAAGVAAVFLIPWTLTLRSLPGPVGALSIACMLLFLAILGVGLLHAWRERDPDARG